MYIDQNVVILPYFSNEEVTRYLKIAERIGSMRPAGSKVHYLLANSLRIEPSQPLQQAYSQLGPCTSFTCPTPIFGYPEGPTAMYWDCMRYVSERFSNLDGFCLWLESDMAPVQDDWLDRLSEQWHTGDRPLMMGCHVPNTYKKRFFRRPKLVLHEHINGGACYATDFANQLPPSARHGVFDMAVYQYAQGLGRVRETDLISFSTLSRVRRDVMDPNKVVLHGYLQDKDSFIDACLRPISEKEQQLASWHPLQDRIEHVSRSVRVQIFRRGHRTMLDNVLLNKQKVARKKAA